MAFNWNSRAGKDKHVTSDEMTEIKNNIDYIHTNLACVTENSTYVSTAYSGKITCNTKHTSFDSSDKRIYDSSQKISVKTGEDISYDLGEHGSVLSSQYYTEKGVNNYTHSSCSSKYGTVHSADRGSIYWTH